jgi:hypothetical protein
MKVSELLEFLQDKDPDAEVVFVPHAADLDENYPILRGDHDDDSENVVLIGAE